MHVLNQLTLSKSRENAFITVGFDNSKDATRSFEQHRKSACHRKALMKWEHHTKGSGVIIQLQHQLASDQEKGKHCLMKLFTSVEYLARQALPLCGHYEASDQLMQLRANGLEELKTWLHQKKKLIHLMRFKTKCLKSCPNKYSCQF